MKPDILLISDKRGWDLLRITPEGRLRGSLVFRLKAFVVVNSVLAGTIGGLIAKVF